MQQITETQAKSELSFLIDKTAETHEPIYIAGARNKAVLISEEDWRSIQETLYILSVPGARETIVEGMSAPVEELLSEAEFYAELDKENEAE